MKLRLAAGVACLCAAFGIGAGVAQAAEAPVSAPPVNLAVPSVEIDVPAQLPQLPSSSDVLAFLSESLTLMGRDIVQKAGITTEALPSTITAETLESLASTDPAADDPRSGLNKVGDQFDDFWYSIEKGLRSIPKVGDKIALPIEKFRDSKAWDNDYFRIFFTVGLFSIPALPVLGFVAGVAISAVIALGIGAIPALPIIAAGAFGGFVAGFFAFGAGLLAGGAAMFFAALFGLLFLGAGITLILLAAGIIIPGIGIAAAVGAGIAAAVLIILAPLFLLAIGSGIGVVIAGLAGWVLLTGAGIALLLIPALVVTAIVAAIAFVIVAVIVVPVLTIGAPVLGVAIILLGVIIWAAMGSTRPEQEMKEKKAKQAEKAAANKKAAEEKKAAKDNKKVSLATRALVQSDFDLAA